jgi:hypothetical protein
MSGKRWLEPGDQPFVLSLTGGVLYFSGTFALAFSQLGFADLSPEIFGNASTNATVPRAGLTVASAHSNVPRFGIEELILGSLIISLIVSVPVLLLRWGKVRRWVVTGCAGVLYGFSYYASSLIPGIQLLEYSFPHKPPAIQFLSILLAVGFVFALTAVFQYRMVPSRVLKSDSLERYMQNQWRFAQAALSITVALVVGVSVPFALQYARTWLFGIGFLILFLTTVPVLVLTFLIGRIHYLEERNRDYW